MLVHATKQSQNRCVEFSSLDPSEFGLGGKDHRAQTLRLEQVFEQQHEVLLLVVDIVHNHHAHIHDFLADSVEIFIFKTGREDAVTCLVALWTVEFDIFFVHLDIAVGMDCVGAGSNGCVRFALISVNGSTDALILVDMCQVNQCFVGFRSLMANEAYFSLFTFFFFTAKVINGFIYDLLLFWIVHNS